MKSNATGISDRKLKEVGRTIVEHSFDAHSTKQPVSISSALYKVIAM